MKNLKVTAMILAATLSAGTLVACSSNEEANTTTTTMESEATESETEESVSTESEAGSELTTEQETDAMTEAVLRYITVARVENIGEDGSLDLTLFELPEATVEEQTEEETESATTESVTTEATTTESATTESETAEENPMAGNEFDFASLDFSMFVETELTEAYQPEETVMVQLVEDGALVEAALSDIQEGDMLVIFVDENEVPNIIIYRNIGQEEKVAE